MISSVLNIATDVPPQIVNCSLHSVSTLIGALTRLSSASVMEVCVLCVFPFPPSKRLSVTRISGSGLVRA